MQPKIAFGAFFLLHIWLLRPCHTRQVHRIYWNTANPLFSSTSVRDNVIHVNQYNQPDEYDQLDLYCPADDLEEHVVHLVTKQEYDTCQLSPDRPPRVVVKCTADGAAVRRRQPDTVHSPGLTLSFRPFRVMPNAPIFAPGQTYYMMSAPRVDDAGMQRNYCRTHNMKAAFRVASAPPTRPPSPPVAAVNTGHRPGIGPNVAHEYPEVARLYADNPTHVVGQFQYVQRREGHNDNNGHSTTSGTARASSVRSGEVRSSDYLYYYTPRDLLQLKLAVSRHMKSIGVSAPTNSDEVVGLSEAMLRSGGSKMDINCTILSMSILLVSIMFKCFVLN